MAFIREIRENENRESLRLMSSGTGRFKCVPVVEWILRAMIFSRAVFGVMKMNLLNIIFMTSNVAQCTSCPRRDERISFIR